MSQPDPDRAKAPPTETINRASTAAALTGTGLGLAIAGLAVAVLVRGEIGDGASDLVTFIGRFHPLILHLPIGGLSYLLLVEFLRWIRKGRGKPERLPALLFTAATAALAAALGYLLGETGDYSSNSNFMPHFRWGVIFAGCSGLALALGSLHMRWRSIPGGVAYTLTVLASMGSLGLAGHAGASLTHGEEYLTAYAPEPLKSYMEQAFGIEPREEAPSADEIASIPIEERDLFVHVVTPILDNHCYACHSAEMQKGQLRLDSYEAIVAGGEEGSSIVPGDPDASLLISRMELPLEDEEHMPPKEKPQHDEKALLVLREWIAIGAPEAGAVGELDLSAAALAAIGSGVTDAPEKPLEHGVPDAEQLARRAELEPHLVELQQHLGSSAVRFVSRDSADIEVSLISMGSGLNAGDLEALEPIATAIVALDLSQTPADNAMLASLPELPALATLNLASTPATTIAPIAGKLPALRRLIAYSSQFSDASLEGLLELPALEEAVLSFTAVTPEAAEAWVTHRPEVTLVVGTKRFGSKIAEPAQENSDATTSEAPHDEAGIAEQDVLSVP